MLSCSLSARINQSRARHAAEAAGTKAGALDASLPRDALDRLYNRISDMAAGSKAMLRVIRQKVRL